MPSKAPLLIAGAALVGAGALAFFSSKANAATTTTGGTKTPKSPAPKPPAATSTPPAYVPYQPPTASGPSETSPPAPSPDRALARELALHLTALQLATGGPKQAKGKEDRELVGRFQKAAGLTVDKSAGPATFIGIARRGVSSIPLVMYWPKKADAKTVLIYRTALRAIAGEPGVPMPVSDAIRAAANRERGQGGINGPLAADQSGAGVA